MVDWLVGFAHFIDSLKLEKKKNAQHRQIFE